MYRITNYDFPGYKPNAVHAMNDTHIYQLDGLDMKLKVFTLDGQITEEYGYNDERENYCDKVKIIVDSKGIDIYIHLAQRSHV
jgi:hypothetical protein